MNKLDYNNLKDSPLGDLLIESQKLSRGISLIPQEDRSLNPSLEKLLSIYDVIENREKTECINANNYLGPSLKRLVSVTNHQIFDSLKKIDYSKGVKMGPSKFINYLISNYSGKECIKYLNSYDSKNFTSKEDLSKMKFGDLFLRSAVLVPLLPYAKNKPELLENELRLISEEFNEKEMFCLDQKSAVRIHFPQLYRGEK